MSYNSNIKSNQKHYDQLSKVKRTISQNKSLSHFTSNGKKSYEQLRSGKSESRNRGRQSNASHLVDQNASHKDLSSSQIAFDGIVIENNQNSSRKRLAGSAQLKPEVLKSPVIQ